MSSQMDEREVARVGNAIREALQLPATVQNAALGRIAARAAIEATRPPVVADEVVERVALDQTQFGELLIEFIADQFDDGSRSQEYWDWFASEIRTRIASMPAVVSGGQGEPCAWIDEQDALRAPDGYHFTVVDAPGFDASGYPRKAAILTRNQPEVGK